MALHVDGEGEIGSAGGLVLLKIAVDCGQKIGVLGVDGVRHVLKVALHEAVALQAHVGVDILPVVKPLVIGVAALRRVALAAQVPGVGVDVMAEVVEAVVAREKAPLRVNGAAGEDVGHQIAGIALRLQLVIELVAAGVQPWDVVSGEISVGLPHDGDDADFPVRRDVLVLISGQQRHRLALAVAGGGDLPKIPDAVDKGVEKAVGDVIFRVAPHLQVLEIVHRVIAVLVVIERQQGGAGQDQGRQRDQPLPPPQPASGQQGQQQRTRQQAGGNQKHPGIDKQVVVSAVRHGGGLPEVEHILKEEGVVPELNFEKIPQAQAKGGQPTQEKARPGPAQQGIRGQDQHNHRRDVQHSGIPGLQISVEDLAGERAHSQQQHQYAQPHPGGQQQRGPPDIVDGLFPYRPGGVCLPPQQENLVQKTTQSITFPPGSMRSPVGAGLFCVTV